MEIRIIIEPISAEELEIIAKEGFGDLVKVAVDVEQEIMAVGGELHMDEATFLHEEKGSQYKHIWGINLYPSKLGGEFIEFDSMVNLKPALGNRSRGVNDANIREKIKNIVKKLITT